MEMIDRILKNSLGADGRNIGAPLSRCEECNEFVERDIELMGVLRRVKRSCSCDLSRREEREKVLKEQERRDKARLLSDRSFLDSRYRDAKFSNWDHSVGNAKLYNISYKYAMNYDKAILNNLGLIISGEAGCGKSYAVSCICNHLVECGVPTVCISVNRLFQRIKDTYNDGARQDEDGVIMDLTSVDFLIIDDLGVELLNDWCVSRVYKVVDSRYRNNLPTVITTNLSMGEIGSRYGERVYDRLVEMCTRVFCDGSSIRRGVGDDKARRLMGIVKGEM